MYMYIYIHWGIDFIIYCNFFYLSKHHHHHHQCDPDHLKSNYQSHLLFEIYKVHRLTGQ